MVDRTLDELATVIIETADLICDTEEKLTLCITKAEMNDLMRVGAGFDDHLIAAGFTERLRGFPVQLVVQYPVPVETSTIKIEFD